MSSKNDTKTGRNQIVFENQIHELKIKSYPNTEKKKNIEKPKIDIE